MQVRRAWLVLLAATVGMFLMEAQMEGACVDKLGGDGGRTMEGVELIGRFHPVGEAPEVDIGAHSERKDRGENVRAHFGRVEGLPNGDIIAAHNERETSVHGWDPTNRTIARLSQDGGYTWTIGTDVFAEVRGKATKKAGFMGHSQLALTALSDGTILLGPVYLDDGTWRIPRSRDAGKTWDFELQAPRFLRDYVEMSNGEIGGLGDYPTGLGVNSRTLFVTDRTMKEWTPINLGRQAGYETDEACVVETGTAGELYMLMRDQEDGHYLSQAWSGDYGRTWSGYGPSGLWLSLRPSKPYVTRGADGLLLAAHSERSNGRIVVTASFDGGRTWELGRRIYVLDSPEKHLAGSSGYCSLAPSGENTWFVAWYDATSFRGSNIDLSYITRPYEGVRLSAEAEIEDPQVIARWSFEEKEGGSVRGIPNGDYGRAKLVGRKEGRIGGAISFNGRNSMVQIPDTPTMRVKNVFTIDCFVRAEQLEGEQALVSKRPYYYLGLSGDKVTFQIGDAPETQSGRPTFRLDAEEPLETGRWYHLAAAVGTPRLNYKTARIHIDGKRVAEEKLSSAGMGEDCSFAEAAYYLDQRPEKGPMYMNYGKYTGYCVDPTWHLCLGVDNVTGKAAFRGELDEVTLYGRALLPAEIERLSLRGYSLRPEGTLTTEVIPLDGYRWGTFQAQAEIPEGTSITFEAVNEDGTKTLVKDLKNGQSLAEVKAEKIRLRAVLRTTDGGRTPVLRSWGITGSGDD
ncbi:MAG: LamG-like jellyroll fold domain-containing protein [Planctomycetota bacterium]